MRLDRRVILALDVTDTERARSLARSVRGEVDAIKVNWPLVLAGGLGIVRELSAAAYVLCDFKIADIPNTNRLIIEQAARAFEAPFFYASAKTGDNVEFVFRRLGTMTLQREGLPAVT